MKKATMRSSCVIGGLLLGLAGTAFAQDDYPKVETAPGFSYQHNSPVLGGSQGFNCAGGGGTVAYNMTSMFGLAADLSGCKAFGLNNTYGIGSKVNGSELTYVFGPRITFRRGKFQPFFEINFGGERVKVACNKGNAGNACDANLTPSQQEILATLQATQTVKLASGQILSVPHNPSASSFSKQAFAMTVGGGFDIKLNRKFALRLVQAEYLYTHFGNNCPLAYCTENNSQNSFRLKSGIVIGWGGAK